MTYLPIPSHWQWKPISDLGTPLRPVVKAGPFGSALKKDFYVSSGFRVYGQEQVIAGSLKTGNYYIDKSRFESLRSCEVKAGDVLVSLVGTLGKTLVVPAEFEPGIINPRLVRLSLDSKKLVAAYFVHYFQSGLCKTQINLKSHGGTMGIINAANISELLVPVPPIQEQLRIADVLDRAEVLRAKRRAALAELDSLEESLFRNLIGDPVENPKNWDDSAVLGDVADIVSGVTKGRKLTGCETREIDYLAVANVQDRALALSTVKRIWATESEIRRYKLQKGDLLLTEGGDPDKLGRGTLWNDELPECIHQNHIFRVRLTNDRLHPLFVSRLVASQRGKRYFLRAAKQTTGIASINMTQLRDFPLLIPPQSVQQQFAKQIAVVEKLKETHRSSLAELDSLFASLQHRAFRGEL